MIAPRRITNRARANQQTRRLNELARVIRDELNTNSHEHRDTESYTERAWQGSADELHIGFRVQTSKYVDAMHKASQRWTT